MKGRQRYYILGCYIIWKKTANIRSLVDLLGAVIIRDAGTQEKSVINVQNKKYNGLIN